MNKNLILHPIFVLCLTLLLLNDFYLKSEFSNLITGKLSDFAGLIVFPIFIAYFLPKTKPWICLITGVLFLIWKTPLVEPIIKYCNEILPFEIKRIVDYTDYLALLSLPFAQKIIKTKTTLFTHSGHFIVIRLMKFSLSILAFFAICATSVPPRFEIPKGTIYIGKSYTIKKSKKEIINKIKTLGYNVDYYENKNDSIIQKPYSALYHSYYQSNNIIIYDDSANPIDTILNVKYTLNEYKKNKTQLKIINVTLTESNNIQKWQTLKYLRKRYKNYLKDEFIEPVE